MSEGGTWVRQHPVHNRPHHIRPILSPSVALTHPPGHLTGIRSEGLCTVLLQASLSLPRLLSPCTQPVPHVLLGQSQAPSLRCLSPAAADPRLPAGKLLPTRMPFPVCEPHPQSSFLHAVASPTVGARPLPTVCTEAGLASFTKLGSHLTLAVTFTHT